jgi:hypothetical protein
MQGRHTQFGGSRGHSLAFGLVVCAAACALFAGLLVYLRDLERRAVAATAVHDQLTPTGQLRPAAEILQAVREMQLVTVEINTRVTATVEHESWRGDVVASVEAPVRLLYGSNLAQLRPEAIAYSPMTRSYAVRIPPPRRIATEVCGDDESIAVQVGWLRLRSRAGEYHLGLARRGLYERARELTLTPDDAAMVRESTRRQVEALVRRIVGRDAAVTVAFEDGGTP